MDVIYNAIDVSKHQGKINWEAVKNAGVTHAMLRAGYGRYKNQVDPQFERNSAECERLGIQYGVLVQLCQHTGGSTAGSTLLPGRNPGQASVPAGGL